MTGEPLDREIVSCAEIEERDLLAQYVAGQLPDAERDRVEAHAIACARCAGDLEALLIAREALNEAPSRLAPWLLGGGLLAAAALLILLLLPRGAAPTRPQAPAAASGALAQLAHVDPPPYTPFAVRSADQEAVRFNEAMAAYSTRDFARAADLLRAVVATDASRVQAQFYLGASLMMTGDARGAADALRHVVAGGPSPFHDSAELLLAKALIRAGDLDAAARTLGDASHGTGARAAEAADLQRQLDAVRASRRR